MRYHHNLSTYYDQLEPVVRRNYSDVSTLAVHRCLHHNKSCSTLVHYELIHSEIARWAAAPVRLLDAGCGIGGGLLWLERREPGWQLDGYTISEAQQRVAMTRLPLEDWWVQGFGAALFQGALLVCTSLCLIVA